VRVTTEHGCPIIEGTTAELAKVGTAVLGTIREGEAVIRQGGVPVVAFRLADPPAEDGQ
jgi:hypothetical protein